MKTKQNQNKKKIHEKVTNIERGKNEKKIDTVSSLIGRFINKIENKSSFLRSLHQLKDQRL